MWNYSKSLEFFSVSKDQDSYPRFGLQRRIDSKGEVEATLREAFSNKDAIHVLEVVMPTLDAPEGMVKTAEKAAEENKYGGNT